MNLAHSKIIHNSIFLTFFDRTKIVIQSRINIFWKLFGIYLKRNQMFEILSTMIKLRKRERKKLTKLENDT